MEVAALRTLHLDACEAAVRLSLPIPWVSDLVSWVAGKGRWNHWELDRVSVRGDDEARALVTLRFASDGDEPQGTGHREALMDLVMIVLDRLRERWKKDHPVEEGETS